ESAGAQGGRRRGARGERRPPRGHAEARPALRPQPQARARVPLPDRVTGAARADLACLRRHGGQARQGRPRPHALHRARRRVREGTRALRRDGDAGKRRARPPVAATELVAPERLERRRVRRQRDDLLPAAVGGAACRRRSPASRTASSPYCSLAARTPLAARDRGSCANCLITLTAGNADAVRASPARPDTAPQAAPRDLFLERRPRQPVSLELRVVELGELTVPRPDHSLPRVVDRVREPHPLVVVDAGNRLRERERDAFEGVVVVVEDDHAPGAAGARPSTPRSPLLRRSQGRHASKVAITASAITRNGRPETWLALRRRAKASASLSFSRSISRPFARSITFRSVSACASESASARTASSSS